MWTESRQSVFVSRGKGRGRESERESERERKRASEREGGRAREREREREIRVSPAQAEADDEAPEGLISVPAHSHVTHRRLHLQTVAVLPERGRFLSLALFSRQSSPYDLHLLLLVLSLPLSPSLSFSLSLRLGSMPSPSPSVSRSVASIPPPLSPRTSPHTRPPLLRLSLTHPSLALFFLASLPFSDSLSLSSLSLSSL